LSQQQEDQRRLSAIVFTDIVNYSSLVQRSETQALSVLEKHNALIRSELAKYQGREIKTIGDAFLLEFSSALEAVLFSVNVQRALYDQNALKEQDNVLLLRIGIHVGDVIHRGGDIFGDAVNIASRIVNFAEEGGICMSEQVYAQIRNKIQYRTIEMPETHLEHIEQPVSLYQLVLPWFASEEKGVIGSRGKGIRVAVLPFSNISPDPNDGYLAEGLTEELISSLSEVKGLRVIARTSVNRYRDTEKSLAQIGNELTVAYIVEGSVRKAGSKIRINAQLIDIESQEHVWSSRYERELQDVFLIQTDIAKQIIDSMKVTLLKEEKVRIEKKGTENLAAYVAYLKGRAMLHDRTERAIRAAKNQFELAIKEDPGYARAYAGLADIHLMLGDYLFAPVPSSLEEAKANIEKALELDPTIAEAHVSLAYLVQFDYKFGEAEEEFRKAIALNPSYATCHHWYVSLLESKGQSSEAFQEVLLAEQLDPLSSAITLSVLYRCLESARYDEAEKRIKKLEELDQTNPMINEAYMVYHFARKDWENSLRYLKKMIEEDPLDPYLDSNLAYIYAVTGRKDESLELIEKMEKTVPDDARIKGTLIAFPYSGLGNLDKCFRWLEYAFEKRELFFGWYRNYPLLSNVQEDKRFANLLKRAGLPV
jgi:adenylate cyclase